MTADAHGVLNDLLNDYSEALIELRALRSTIDKLAKKYGIEYQLPSDGDTDAPVRSLKVTPGQFFGKSQTDAAAEFLKFIGRPQTMDEILAGIIEGGAKVGGADPRQTVYTQIIRSTHRFVKVDDTHIGLLDWYPEEKARRRRKGKGKPSASEDTASGGELSHEEEQDDSGDTGTPEANESDPDSSKVKGTKKRRRGETEGS